MNIRIATAALAWPLLALAQVQAADWPGFRGDNCDGQAEASTSLKSLATAKELWRIPLGESFSQISIAGDKAVVFVMKGKGEAAVCLDPKSGKEQWSTPIDSTTNTDTHGQGPRATPAISAGMVFVYSSSMKLVALDLSTGKTLWHQDILKDYGGRKIGWGPAASPLVVDDRVIVIGGGAGKGIMAFDKKTGKAAWSATDDVHTHATPTVAVIEGQKQVIAFMVSGLVSVDAKSGDVLWRYPFSYKVSTAASPIVGGIKGNIVFCSAGYQVGAGACRVSKQGASWTAKELWKNSIQNHWASGIHKDGYIYCLDGFKNGKCPLVCLDIETGDIKWKKDNFGSQGGLIRVGDGILINTPNGDLVLVEASPAGYSERGRLSAFAGGKHRIWNAPSFADGRVFVRDTLSEAVCFEVR